MRYPRTNRPKKKKHNIVPLKPRTGTLNKKKRPSVFVRDTLNWLNTQADQTRQPFTLYSN